MTLAVVRIKGILNNKAQVSDTLKMLNLNKPNHCTLIEENPQTMGMLKRVESLITWGPVSEDNKKALQKRGGKKYFRLNPPKKGYGRKGIKMPFTKGGAYGDRGDKINDLITRMI